jgi:hypothetical protein
MSRRYNSYTEHSPDGMAPRLYTTGHISGNTDSTLIEDVVLVARIVHAMWVSPGAKILSFFWNLP